MSTCAAAQDADDPTRPVVAQMRATVPRGVGMPALRALAGAGFTDIDSLDGAMVSRLLAPHGMGPKAISAPRETLAERGKAFGA